MASAQAKSTALDLRQPLTSLQVELLKLYSTGISEGDLLELKEELAHFFARKAIAGADKEWEERHLTNQDMDAWLQGG